MLGRTTPKVCRLAAMTRSLLQGAFAATCICLSTANVEANLTYHAMFTVPFDSSATHGSDLATGMSTSDSASWVKAPGTTVNPSPATTNVTLSTTDVVGNTSNGIGLDGGVDNDRFDFNDLGTLTISIDPGSISPPTGTSVSQIELTGVGFHDLTVDASDNFEYFEFTTGSSTLYFVPSTVTNSLFQTKTGLTGVNPVPLDGAGNASFSIDITSSPALTFELHTFPEPETNNLAASLASISFTVTAVPEPTSFLCLATVFVAVGLYTTSGLKK